MPERLTVLGSSDAFNSAGRLHSCYLLEGDGFGPIMVDFGATAMVALRRAGRAPTELAGLAITHLHGDHVGGFPFLLIDGMFKGVRTAPLPILGPVGVTQRLADGIRLAYGDLMDREMPFTTSFEELAPGDRAVLAGAEVTAFPAEHMDPPEQPLCLRFRLPSDKVVAFSGDTMMCDGLLGAAAGADLLVAECTGLAPPAGRHCTWEDWERVLPTMGVPRVVLSHLNDAVRARADDLLDRAPPGIELSFADDGMIVDL
ncbi:MAG: MBL fold metallo-hydrolase [Myxococcota bacterium]